MTDQDTSHETGWSFLQVFAVFWSIASMSYIAAITFLSIPEKNTRFADTVLGFLLGTVIGAILKFYYDTSRSAQAKDAALSDIAKMPINPIYPQADSTTLVTPASTIAPTLTPTSPSTIISGDKT